MGRRLRLDAELVRRGLATSREDAVGLVSAGRVSVGGQVATKPATQVLDAAAIVVRGAGYGALRYVSRGGHKLAGILDRFPDHGGTGVAVSGRRALDAGASTGGFTDVLLRRGAVAVVAVDVGYGQLAWSLRRDPRVTVCERTNVRTLDADTIGGPVELIVADLSFISLGLVLPALAGCLAPDADLLALVKPQFEVGRGNVGAGGVVRDPRLRAAAVATVAESAARAGLGVAGLDASALPGPAGNVEYFLWLRTDAATLNYEELDRVVANGPS